MIKPWYREIVEVVDLGLKPRGKGGKPQVTENESNQQGEVIFSLKSS